MSGTLREVEVCSITGDWILSGAEGSNPLSISIKFNLAEMDLFDIVNRVPRSKQPNGHDCEENKDKIGHLHIHGVSADNETAVISAKPYQTETDLHPAYDGSQ